MCTAAVAVARALALAPFLFLFLFSGFWLTDFGSAANAAAAVEDANANADAAGCWTSRASGKLTTAMSRERESERQERTSARAVLPRYRANSSCSTTPGLVPML